MTETIPTKRLDGLPPESNERVEMALRDIQTFWPGGAHGRQEEVR